MLPMLLSTAGAFVVTLPIESYTIKLPATCRVRKNGTDASYYDNRTYVASASDSTPIGLDSGNSLYMVGPIRWEYPLSVPSSSGLTLYVSCQSAIAYRYHDGERLVAAPYQQATTFYPLSCSATAYFSDNSSLAISLSALSSGALVSYGGSLSLPSGKSLVKVEFSFSYNTLLTGDASSSTNYCFFLACSPSFSLLEPSSGTDVSGIEELLRNILAADRQVVSMLTPSSGQQSASDSFLQDMEDVTQQIEDTNKIIEDNTNRPSADSLVPDVPDIIQDGVIGGGDAVATAMMGDFGSLLSSPLILQLLILVFTLAFLSYVLFGKKE